MKQPINLFKPTLLASCIALALSSCGGSSDAPLPTGGGDPDPVSTTFNFNVDIPSEFDSTAARPSNGIAAKIDPLKLKASDIKVAIVDSSGKVTKIITPLSFTTETDSNGKVTSYNLKLPGGLRVDCVILVDVDGTATVEVDQPLPANVLVAPTTSSVPFDIDIQSTSAFREFIEKIPDNLDLQTGSGFTPAQVQNIIKTVQKADLPPVKNGQSLENYLNDAFADLEKIIETEIEIIEVIKANPNAESFNLATYFITDGGAFSWFDGDIETYEQNGTTNIDIDLEYGHVTNAGETNYYYDPNNDGFVESNENDDINDIYLSSNGTWLERLEDASTFTANADGSIRGNNSATVDGVQGNDLSFDVKALVQLPLEGKSIKSYLLANNSVWAQATGNDPVFNSGAEAFRVEITEVNPSYSIWRWDNNNVANFSSAQNTVNDNLDNLAALQVATASTSTDPYNGGMNLIRIDDADVYNSYVEFVTDGTLNIYTVNNNTATKTGSATWVSETGAGNTTFMVIPRSEATEGLFDDEDEGGIIFVEYEVSTGVNDVVRGNKYNAGYKEDPFFLFNDQAKDDILANINVRRLEIQCGYETDTNQTFNSFTDFGFLVENCGGANIITSENLVGTWNEDDSNESIVFAGDGTFVISEPNVFTDNGNWTIGTDNLVTMRGDNNDHMDIWALTPNGIKAYTEETGFPSDLTPDSTADGEIWNGDYTKQTNNQSNSEGRFSISSELSFGTGSTKATSYLDTKNITNINQLSATVSVDGTSTVTSGARIETDIRIMYQPLANRNQGALNEYAIVLRLKNEGAGAFVQSLMYLCLNENCSQEVVIPSVDSINLTDWSSTADIGIEYLEGMEKFILSYNGQSVEIPIISFNSHAGVINAGVTFATSDSLKARIRTRVRNIDNAGESGNITAYYDDATINGVLVDDFSSNDLDLDIWQTNTFNSSVASLTCNHESGWDDNAYNGVGGPINPNSFADFKEVVDACGTFQALTFDDVKGKVFSKEGETGPLTFNDTGTGTESDRATGIYSDTDENIDFQWYIDENGFLVLYTDTTIDADLDDTSMRVTWALTGIDGNNYSFVVYDEAARYGDMVRDTGDDAEIWSNVQILQ